MSARASDSLLRRFLRQARVPCVAGFLAFLMVAALPILPGNNARARTTSPAPQDEKPPAGNSQDGKKLYTNYGCFECHGHQAEGTSAAGPRLGPKHDFVPGVRQVHSPAYEPDAAVYHQSCPGRGTG